MSERIDVDLEPGFVLHQRPYRNSSQLVEFLSAEHGRIGLVARGSRRQRTGSRAALQPFRRLRVSWTRRGELGSLTGVETDGPEPVLGVRTLLSAYYVNELMLRLTARDDPNAEAYACYSGCLSALQSGGSLQRTLRVYELGLLQALGYGLQLVFDAATHAPIEPDALYAFDPETGPRMLSADSEAGYLGRDLISLRERRLDDEPSLHAARRLLAGVLHAHVGGRLRTRDVLRDMSEKGLAG